MSTLELENIKHPDNSGNNIELNSNGSMVFDRQSTDGTITEYRKSGTTVGSIGGSANILSIVGKDGNGGIAIQNNTYGDIIYPASNTTGGASNGAIDLGYNNGRWKDLYLSGGVYLGGTGSANKLDDYEEGTWTPEIEGTTTAGTYNYGQRDGYYTKVGNLVTIIGTIQGSGGTGAGNLLLVNLPFTMKQVHTGHGSFQVNSNCTFPSGTIGYNFVNELSGTRMYVRCTLSNTNFQYLTYQTTIEYLRFTLQYHTDT